MSTYAMRRSKRGHAIEEGQRFLKGEYVLSRRFRRWLIPRIEAATRNDAVRLAAASLARLILQKHADPRVMGRDFFLCREGLPKCFVDEKGPIHTEWHLRLAKAVLIKIGFIARVTPVAERRFFRFPTKSGEKVRREGRWLPATLKHIPKAHRKPNEKAKGFRAPPVLHRLTTVTLSLLGSPLPGERVPVVSPEYKTDNHRIISTPYDRRDGKYSGGSSAVNTVNAERAVIFADLDARRKAVKSGVDPFGGRKLGDFRTRRERF